MSRHDVSVLTLRAFAIYAWLRAIEWLGNGLAGISLSRYLLHGQIEMTVRTALSLFGPPIIFVAVGLFLFVRSVEMASWLLPLASQATDEDLPPHPLAAASVAFAVVGVAVFLFAVPGALTFGIRFANITDAADRAMRFRSEAPQIVGNAAQLILGYVLFIKSRSFATAWWRTQQPKPSE